MLHSSMWKRVFPYDALRKSVAYCEIWTRIKLDNGECEAANGTLR